MFGDINGSISIEQCCVIEKGSSLTREQARGGTIPVVAGGITPSCYHNQANRPSHIITISASGANAGYVNFWNTPIFATDCNTLLSTDISKFIIEFIYYALVNLQESIFRLQRGSGQPHVYAKDIKTIMIPNAPISLQNEFADYVKSIDKLKFEVKNNHPNKLN